MNTFDGTRWIIGDGNYLDIAFCAWKLAYPNEKNVRVEVIQNPDYSFNLKCFDEINPVQDRVFIAVNERFGNFKRMELFQAALEKGLKLDTFTSPRAMLGSDVSVGINSFIADGVILEAKVKVDYNTVIGSGTIIGYSSKIKPACWIEKGVNIGADVSLGTYSILRTGVVLAPGIKVGKGCEIAIAGSYRADIAAKTVFDPRYDSPIYVTNF